MDNFIVLENRSEDSFDAFYYDTRREAGLDILTLPVPTSSSLRFEKEQIWGANGYITSTDDAFDGEEGTIEILVSGNEARKNVINAFSSKRKYLWLYINTDKYFRIGKVTNHYMELLNSRDSFHTIDIAFQPFYYEKPISVTSTTNITNDTDGGAALIFSLDRTSPAPGNVGLSYGEATQQVRWGINGLIVDGLRKTITDQGRRPLARSGLEDRTDKAPAEPRTVDIIYSSGESFIGSYTGDLDINQVYRGYRIQTFRFPELHYYNQGTRNTIGVTSTSGRWHVQIFKRHLLPHDVYQGLWRNERIR